MVPSSERASTRLMRPLPLVMKRFTPFRRQVPSGCSVALSCTFCRSEPASGSVRAMEPVTSPLAKRGRNAAFIASSANLLIVSEMSWRPKMFISAGSARLTISTIITLTETGKLRPPYLRGSVMPMRSACRGARGSGSMPGA